MGEINQLKFSHFNSSNKDVSKQIRSHIAKLNDLFARAMQGQCYARKNPDEMTGMATYIAGMEIANAEIIAQFRDLQKVIDDFEAAQTDAAKVDQNIIDYQVDLSEFSNSLL